MKTKKTLIFCAVFGCIATSLALLVNNVKGLTNGLNVESQASSYSLVMNKDRNKVTVDSTGARKDINFRSSVNNNFLHTIYNVAPTDGYWGTMLNGGYVVPKNTNFIKYKQSKFSLIILAVFIYMLLLLMNN